MEYQLQEANVESRRYSVRYARTEAGGVFYPVSRVRYLDLQRGAPGPKTSQKKKISCICKIQNIDYWFIFAFFALIILTITKCFIVYVKEIILQLLSVKIAIWRYRS